MAKETSFPGPIKTIVVLVMENRSFDHMVGWQKQRNPGIDGVTGHETNALPATSTRRASLVRFSNNATYVQNDPGHSFQAVYEQVFGVAPLSTPEATTSATPTAFLNKDHQAPMNGFAKQAESIKTGLSRSVMSGFKPEALLVYTTLVQEFALFDRWFCSVPSSTQPNRQYVHSATSHGLMSNVTRELLKGLPQRTIFDNLYDSQLTFGIYFQSLPSTLYYRRLRQLKYLDSFHLFDLSFKKHASEGKLPNYVVIEPRYFNHEVPPANDDHPPHDVSLGQAFVKEVYETLRKSPQWLNTLLIITYDEHGGFYDHVPTPLTDVPNPDDINGPEPYYFKFDRLGVRVPTIMVSPWIDKSTVVHAPNGPTASSHYEHSSIPATVKKLFSLSSDFLTKRDAWAATFDSIVLARSTPRADCPETLPTVTHSASVTERMQQVMDKVFGRASRSLSEFQEEIVILASHLRGESKADIEKTMSPKEAAEYAEDAWKLYSEVCSDARRAGVDPCKLIRVKPSPTPGGKPSYDIEDC